MILSYPIKRSLYLAVFLWITACAIDDETSPTPKDVFVKYYGAAGTQYLSDMVTNEADNVVLFGGQTLAEVGADANLYLIEADTIGNEINSVTISLNELIYPDSSTYKTEDIAGSIIREKRSGYIIAGSYGEIVDAQVENTYLYWMYLDNDLQVVKWDTIRTPSGQLLEGDVVQTSDFNVLILGSTTDRAVNDLTPNAGFQYLLVKRDFNADTTIFRKTYGYANSNEYGSNIFEYDNGDLAIIGQTDRLGSAGGASGTNIGIMILNPLATAQKSAKEYGLEINGTNSANDRPFDAIQNSSGFVVVGTASLGSSQQAFVMGISNSGSLIFRQTLESQWGINTTGHSVAETAESDLLVVGSYPVFSVDDPLIEPNSQNKNGEVFVMRTNPFDSPKTGIESNFGLVSGDDEANKVLLLPSGSLLIGATIDFGSGQQMISLHKMNDKAILQRP